MFHTQGVALGWHIAALQAAAAAAMCGVIHQHDHPPLQRLIGTTS
jgi:hypothetical protein